MCQWFDAHFRHHLPPGYFLINWRVTSPKFRARHTLQADFIEILKRWKALRPEALSSNQHLTGERERRGFSHAADRHVCCIL
jgi:hypothetical protein